MKTDRLLSIIIYLLNRDLVSARELADKFEVAVRTIQRDMEAINLAGIPIVSIQGPSGGYSIMENFKLDKRLVSVDDIFYILTSLSQIDASIPGGKISNTIEKVQGLLPQNEAEALGQKRQKLSMDFSAFGGSEKQKASYTLLEEAIEKERLVRFAYTNNRLETVLREVEPMTLVFKWRSWYLFGYCRLRSDYRFFRLGRINDAELLPIRFKRREKTLEEYMQTSVKQEDERWTNITLRFHPDMRPLVEEFYYRDSLEIEGDGSVLLSIRMPEDGWVYGLILSYGSYVEVISPDHLRKKIREIAASIADIYSTPY